MPTTINGIGTHYYGKRNAATRRAVCQACGVDGELTSYDTRLWFVVLYIPIIPLRRKKIIDLCPYCQRHWAANEDQWEMSKQLGVSGAMDRYRSEPSPETALEAHGYLISFRQHEEAETLHRECLEQYPGDAPLRAGLAMQLDQIGRHEEAMELYQRAFALRPDLPEARVGVAGGKMATRDLDEARELLDFLEQPGAGQLYDLGPLDQLAANYQAVGKHQETLEICEHLIAEFPDAGQQHRFRQFVAASEKALGARPSILPKREFSAKALFSPASGRYSSGVRWGVSLAIVGVFVLLGLLLNNEYQRRNRDVYVFNGYGLPITVTFDDRPPLKVKSKEKLVLAEGSHQVRVVGPRPEEFQFEMRSDFWDRWTKKPVWIVNPGGAQAFSSETIYYSAFPKPSYGDLLLGQRWHFLPHVDFAFQPPPQTLKVSQGRVVTKTCIREAPARPLDVFQHGQSTLGDVDRTLDFAESHLTVRRTDAAFINAYSSVARATENGERAKKFFEGGLWAEPISVPWHRAYQDVVDAEFREHELVKRYDVAIARQATAGLLYLRGRVEPEAARAVEFFQRSDKADPQLGWPAFALAFDRSSRGRWDEAREFADRAHAIDPTNPDWSRTRDLVRLAQREFEPMIEEFRATKGLKVLELCEVLSAADRVDEAKKQEGDWLRQLTPTQQSSEAVRSLLTRLQYLRGDFDQLDRWDPYFKAYGLLAVGRLDEAATAMPAPEHWTWEALAIHLAFLLADDPDKAELWKQKAVDGLSTRRSDERRAAELLRRTAPPTTEQLDRVVIHPNSKALLLCVLAEQFPEQKEAYLSLARSLNVRRWPPHHIVDRAVSRE